MKRLLKTAMLYLAALLLPLGGFVLLAETRDNPYRNGFTAALCDKYDRLTTLEGQKLILVGGSSLAFGVRSDLLERELGAAVVNMGTYAALGTEPMLEITRPGVKRGDIVVIAPELNVQTYSDYFNADVMWEPACERRELIRHLSFKKQVEMGYNYFDFSLGRIRLSGQSVADGGVYARSSFNEWGDIFVPRTGNLMAGGYDAADVITLDGLLDDGFIAAVNAFADAAAAVGAEVYFTFPPINERAVGFTDAEEARFVEALTERLCCPVLGTPGGAAYDAGYFYNTNYHPNDAGAIKHTVTLADLLKTALGIGTPTAIPVPPPTETEELPVTDDENAAYFTVREVGGNLYLAGVTALGRTRAALTLPLGYEGRRVVGILEGCFDGCENLTVVTVPDGYRTFEAGAFGGADKLAAIRFLIDDPGRTGIPSEGLFDGTPDGMKVYIPAERYAAFVSSYSWRGYRDRFEKE